MAYVVMVPCLRVQASYRSSSGINGLDGVGHPQPRAADRTFAAGVIRGGPRLFLPPKALLTATRDSPRAVGTRLVQIMPEVFSR